MERHKEIGYDLISVVWDDIENFKRVWNMTDTETKDKIVNNIGLLAIKLCNNEWLPIPEKDGDWTDYEDAAKNNCLLKFDDGNTCRYNDGDWPMAITTHYKR